MARIRTIKPTFWADEKIATLPRPIRLTFLGLISAMSDDHGRARANPRLVCAAVYPLDEDVTPAEVTVHLEMLAESGLIILYEVAGERYLSIVNWLKHQKINRPSDSQLPAPSRKKVGTRNASQLEASVNDHGVLSDDSVSPHAVVEGSVVEGKGKDISPLSGSNGSSVNGSHRIQSWPDEGAGIWTLEVAPIEPARFGKAMKPVVSKHGWPDSKAGMLAYIEINVGKTRKVEWYAGDANRYIGYAKEGITDSEGQLTTYGRLVQQAALRLG